MNIGLSEVEERAAGVRSNDSEERAHIAEDELMLDVLKHVAAGGGSEAMEMAQAVVDLRSERRVRWYA